MREGVDHLMSQHVLLVLRDGEPPRCVGPFLSELSAAALVELEQLREGEYLIQPLEPPTARHRLIPSPVPRDVMCEACGKPYLPTHSAAAPGPNARHPFKLPTVLEVLDGDPPPSSYPLSPEGRAVAAGALADWEEKKAAARRTYPSFPAGITDLAAGGRPITSWIEAHADTLRRFAPNELPQPPKEIEQ
jgi:hypothetical protein